MAGAKLWKLFSYPKFPKEKTIYFKKLFNNILKQFRID